MTYKYLLFKPDFVLTRISTAPFLYTGFSDLGNIAATTIQCYPLAINGQVFEPGLAYLNYFLRDVGLYLSKQDARDIYVNLESRKDLPEIYEQLNKYGSFCIHKFDVLPPRIKPV